MMLLRKKYVYLDEYLALFNHVMSKHVSSLEIVVPFFFLTNKHFMDRLDRLIVDIFSIYK